MFLLSVYVCVCVYIHKCVCVCVCVCVYVHVGEVVSVIGSYGEFSQCFLPSKLAWITCIENEREKMDL